MPGSSRSLKESVEAQWYIVAKTLRMYWNQNKINTWAEFKLLKKIGSKNDLYNVGGINPSNKVYSLQACWINDYKTENMSISSVNV